MQGAWQGSSSSASCSRSRAAPLTFGFSGRRSHATAGALHAPRHRHLQAERCSLDRRLAVQLGSGDAWPCREVGTSQAPCSAGQQVQSEGHMSHGTASSTTASGITASSTTASSTTASGTTASSTTASSTSASISSMAPERSIDDARDGGVSSTTSTTSGDASCSGRDGGGNERSGRRRFLGALVATPAWAALAPAAHALKTVSERLYKGQEGRKGQGAGVGPGPGQGQRGTIMAPACHALKTVSAGQGEEGFSSEGGGDGGQGQSGAALATAANAQKTVELRDGTKVEVFEHGMSLSIVALRGSVPTQWVMDFRSTLGKYSGFGLGQRRQLLDIFQELERPDEKQSAGAADVVTLGDAWLTPAIQRRLIQPIPNAEHSRWWRSLGPRWQQLLRRDEAGMPSAKGHIYAAPYRWGGTLIAYRKDRLERWGGRPITDWSDLVQPQLQRRVAFLESSRQQVAIALKSLGLSANLGADQLLNPKPQHAGYKSSGSDGATSGQLPEGSLAEAVQRRLAELRGCALLYSNRDHIRALQSGDAWVAVGSAQDLLGVAERMSAVQVVVPASGSLLHADLWVVPSGAKGGNRGVGPSPLLPSWLEFGMSPARGQQHWSMKTGLAPHALPEPALLSQGLPLQPPPGERPGEGQLELLYEHNYLPGRTPLRRSEFLLPLDAATINLYHTLLRGAQ